jgi:phage/plasmid-like protein (TIGR03299 family)
MAHEILDNNCVFSLKTEVSGVPWHGIGTGLDVVTPDDVKTYASFDREIVLKDLKLAGSDDLIEGYKASFDSKHGKTLGIVSDKFVLLQPRDLLSAAEFLMNSMGAEISCAATIREGKREFLSLAMPDSTVEARENDSIKRYFNLAQGHDGSLAVSAGSSDVRVVCANTLSAWISERNAVKIRHRGDIGKALATAVAAFASETQSRTEFYQALAGRAVTPSEVIAYYSALTGEDYEDFRKAKRGRPSLGAKIADLLDSPANADGIIWQDAGMPATAWDAYNVATQVITHGSTSKDPLNNLLFGTAHKYLISAEKLASDMFLAE